MRFLLLAPFLLLTNVAFASDPPASCEIAKRSILESSAAGLAQVSNLRFIEILCWVPARPFPKKPGEFRNGLRAAATAYQISGDGARRQVPSEINETGGGQEGEREFVMFNLNLPIDRSERDLEARRYLDRLQKAAPEVMSDSLREKLTETTSSSISQHRAGRFQIECNVLDGTRVVAVSEVELEVLFKGRFSDSYGPPGYWPVPPSAAQP